MERRQAIKGIGLMPVGLLMFAGCTNRQQATPTMATGLGPNEGTVTFTGGAVAAGIGFQWGSGVLTWRGAQHPFRVRGLSVVDVGVSRVSASGTVRNLTRLEDFSGNYVAVAAGAAVAGGGSIGTLRNQNGVTIEGVSTQQGLRLTLAPGGVNITLT
jgi:hypothetical protein